MHIDIQSRVEEFACLFDQIKQRFSEDTAAIAVLQEIKKDMRMSNIQYQRANNKTAPATEKQLGYLKTLGVTVPEGVTKQQASKLIEDAKAMRGNIKQVITNPITIPANSL